MFRQLVKVSSVWRPNARLSIMPVRLFERTSTIDPDRSADLNKNRNAKLTRQRSDDLFESLHEFDESIEKSRASEESTEFVDFVRPAKLNASKRALREENTALYPSLSTKPTDKELSECLDHIKENSDGKTVLNHFVDAIRPALNELEPHQFTIIYEKLNQQMANLKIRKIMSVYWSGEMLRKSSSFVALINQTNTRIQDLNVDALAETYKILRAIKQDPDSAIVKSTIRQIDERLDELDLNQLSEFLLRTHVYLREFPESGQLIRFRASLLEHCRRRILNNELKPDQFYQISRHFYNFLESGHTGESFEMIERIARMILSDCELNFSKCVFLLGDITSAMRGNFADKKVYPGIIAKLIERCNSIIIQAFESYPDVSNNFYQYLHIVHSHRTRLYHQFPSFFDPKLLDLMGNFLANEQKANRKVRHPLSILSLVHNFSNVAIYNQKLIELLCDLIYAGHYPVDRLSVTDYFMLSEYRWPFFDNQRLLNVLKSSQRFHGSLKTRDRHEALLCDLILTETNDPGLLTYLSQTQFPQSKDRFLSSAMRFFNYERTALARVCLSMFSPVTDKELERKLLRTLDQRFHLLCMNGQRASISVKYITIDSRLQHTGYLSNGVHVNAFGIYDKSINDLISLEQYRRKFEDINTIPLTSNQEL